MNFLGILANKGFLKSFKRRYDFRISNASSTVHFKDKTGRTEELDSLLFLDSNYKRLFKELDGINKYIICFGKKAEKTMIKMLQNPKYSKVNFKPIFSRHLGLQSLNKWKTQRIWTLMAAY
ncbi:MAG: hypothetical protein IPG89_15325 [Bacteroidetes bacterium]|nr:hypothetical protein [Bacteroidota bacterium]